MHAGMHSPWRGLVLACFPRETRYPNQRDICAAYRCCLRPPGEVLPGGVYISECGSPRQTIAGILSAQTYLPPFI